MEAKYWKKVIQVKVGNLFFFDKQKFIEGSTRGSKGRESILSVNESTINSQDKKLTDPGMYSRRFPPTFMLRRPSSSPFITCYTHWVECQFVFKGIIKYSVPKTTVFLSLNSYCNEGRILKLKDT